MADEEAHVRSDKKETRGGENHEIESQIKAAMRSRIAHFKKQADSFTFEGVRRLLEEDLGLEAFSLDVHKRFVKQCLLQGLNVADDETKTSGKTAVEEVSSTKETSIGLNSTEDVKEPGVDGEENMEDSELVGRLIGQKKVKSEAEEKQSLKKKVTLSESTITKAMLKRASYIRLNSEKVTMAGVRRLLEDDLKLEKKVLDPFKKFISNKVDEILKMNEASDSATKLKKGSPKDNSNGKAPSEIINTEGISDVSDSEGEDIEEEEVKPRKKIAPKGKIQSEGVRKRQRPAKEPNLPKKKQKPTETISEQDSDEGGTGNVSDDSHAQASDDIPVKKKEVSTPADGKHVEHLKSIIKSCGMSIPPSVYKRVKQGPENKRDNCLIKELEEILSREGLSANPSEKEIKEVRKKKERAKELEGIDMSNIVLTSRRRSTTSSFVAPLKPKIPVESDGDDDAEHTDNDDEDNSGDDDDEEDNDDDNDDDDGNANSQSEDLNEDEGSD